MLADSRPAILHCALLTLTLTLFVYLGAYRALPYNVMLRQNAAHDGGATIATVFRAHRDAKRLAADPPWALHHHLIFKEHNPGLFQLLTVLCIQAGVEDLFALQMLPLAFTTLSLLALYFLILGLFRDRSIALASVVYISLTPSFLGFATALYAPPYGRFLSLGAALAFLHYLRTSRRILFALAFLGYFLACWNYWEWYVETALFLLGVHYVERDRLFSRELGILALAPLSAFAGFLALLSIARGGLGNAIQWLMSVFTFRTLDQTGPSGYLGEFYEPGQFLDMAVLGGHLERISTRIEGWYYLSPALLAVMLAIVLTLHPRARNRAYRMFLFLLPAAFYWHFAMIQHTTIHSFTAALHYPLIALIFGCFVVETPRYVSKRLGQRPFRKTIAALVMVPVLLPVVSGSVGYLLPMQKIYWENHERVSSFADRARRDFAGATPDERQALRSNYREMEQELFLTKEYRREMRSILRRRR